MPFNRRKIIDYTLNGLLVVIVIILIVPSWRVPFQGWFQGLFMSEVKFENQGEKKIPPDAQNWALFDMQSKLYNFSEFAGKPIVLSFWATWCPPCRAELPELKELQETFQSDIHLLAISDEPIQVIQNSGLHNDYPFLFSSEYTPGFFEVSSLPTLIIIDSQMNLVFRNVGAAEINTESNHRFLQHLISQP